MKNKIDILKEEYNYKKHLSLNEKIKLSTLRIKQFYNKLNGNVYISFSGGLDSTVLLNLVRSIYPDILAVRVIEPSYKILNDFIKNFDNIEQLNPKISFNKIIELYGYPVVSKSVSCSISRYRKTKNEDVKKYRLTGIKKNGSKGKLGVIPNKWKYLIDAPFKISDRCCDIIKKEPLYKFGKKTNLRPFIGIKAIDSNRRLMQYLKYGCNQFNEGKEKSLPLSFWLNRDIKNYIRKYKLNYCKLYDMGEKNLGCIYCLFGIHFDKSPNRIQRMYNIESKLYNYALNKLKYKMVLDYMNIDCLPIKKLDAFK